jgi:glycosyltransferase involved in cell wall biosynthesis
VPATADLVLRQHGSGAAPAPPERRILLILPDVEIGGGQLNAIRLANALTATHQVFMVNARPEQYDPSVAQLISPSVIPLEGALHRTPWYDPAEPWTRDANNTDERALRVAVVVELMKHFQITTVLSQVWWSDRFTLALRERADFAWFVKFCGCYEALLRAPLTDPSFVEKAQRIMRLVTGATYGSAKNLGLFDDGRFPRPRAMRRVFNGFSRALIDRQPGPSPPRSKSDLVFCICSRAIKEKGWEEAILAVSQVNRLPARERGGKRAKLWLIGDGPVLAPLKRRYAGERDIVFLGPRSRPHSIMAAADAGLLPSYTESVPTAVIESLACDRPVVATAVGAVPQMLAHGPLAAGILVPTLEDHLGVASEALASAMLRYMVDEEIDRAHQQAAGRVFDAHFDMGATLDNYLSFFAEASP